MQIALYGILGTAFALLCYSYNLDVLQTIALFGVTLVLMGVRTTFLVSDIKRMADESRKIRK